ncbi:hypothetical protein, partial [Cetobacterium sp.]|uniref:hypothetical protein n=1 Tax=Cetobacterium sp. TaxID=2071632 RepID=UPI003EE52161
DHSVIIDSSLSFEDYVDNITRTAFFLLRNIAKIRNNAEILAYVFLISRFISRIIVMPSSSKCLKKFQLAKNAAAIDQSQEGTENWQHPRGTRFFT